MSNKQQGLIVLLVFLGLVGLWFIKQDPVLNHLNATLSADQELAAYPYHVHVLKVDNGVVTLSSPRSPQVSVLQFFNIAFPKLDTNNPDSAEMIAAQKQLAHIQEKSAKLVKAQPDIKDVQWEIDKAWYSSHGLIVE
jgi:hypothetical protein